MIDLLWSGILNSRAVREVAVAKSVILDILFLTPFVLALKVAVLANLLMLDTSFLTSFVSALRVVLVAKLVI